MNKLISTFRSLKYKNFRLFFPGLIISQIGIWIQNIALGWIVYDMTKSPFLMGTIMFCNSLPLFIITPFAGVVIDKFSKHKLLMIIQILYALQAFLLTVTTILNKLEIWNIVILGLFINIVAAIDTPLRQSMFACLVDDKKDLGNAISLNSTCFNLARLIGPAIGGILIASVGKGLCFFINFICFIPSIYLVSKMNITQQITEHVKNETILEGLKEGISYIKNNEKVITLLIFLSVFCFIGMTYPMLMPIYTKDVFNYNADMLGYLMAAVGIGALFASLLIASKNTINNMKYILCMGSFIFSLCFVVLGLSHNYFISLIAMFFLGMGMTSCITCDNTLLQSVINDEIRGRVMSIHVICFMGTVSISNFICGIIAQHIGISNTFIALGTVLLIFSLDSYMKFKKLNF